MKAVVMAGGEGTRLRPLTSNQPKPMVPIVGKPCMEHIVELLRKHGFDDIVVTLAFMPQAIRGYFGAGESHGVSIRYSVEESPMGTAGSVKLAEDALDEPFLVISGDALCDIDLEALVRFHEQKEALVTIGLKSVDNPLEFGIVVTDEDGRIERFLEKPTWGQVFSDTINTGIYVLDPAIFDHIEEGRAVDFSSEVFPALLRAEKPVYGCVGQGYWEDVGTLDAYLRAHKDVLDQKVELETPGFRISPRVWGGGGAEVDPGTEIVGPAVIGPGCKLEAGINVGEYVVLGSNVRALQGCDLERSVVHDNVYLGQRASLRGAVGGRASNLRDNARCGEGVVLGDEVFVGANAVLGNDVKVYPFKTIEDGAIVNSSIVWESRGARSLFGRMGVSGLANVDVTPELAAKVAM